MTARVKSNGGAKRSEDFDFDAGNQLKDEAKAILQNEKRPIVFDRRRSDWSTVWRVQEDAYLLRTPGVDLD
jgi:hypothetical protein